MIEDTIDYLTADYSSIVYASVVCSKSYLMSFFSAIFNVNISLYDCVQFVFNAVFFTLPQFNPHALFVVLIFV